MWIKFLPAALAVLLISVPTFAQPDNAVSRPRYFFSLHSGALLGKRQLGTSFTSSLLQGLRHKRLAVGVGIGYDAYTDWRAMPVFATINFDFLHIRGNALFIQMSAGTSKVWNPMLIESEFVYLRDDNIFLNPLLGYRIKGEKFNVYLSAGYKFQSIEYEWSWGGGGGKTYFNRDTQRMAIQLGFGFH